MTNVIYTAAASRPCVSTNLTRVLAGMVLKSYIWQHMPRPIKVMKASHTKFCDRRSARRRKTEY